MLSLLFKNIYAYLEKKNLLGSSYGRLNLTVEL